MTLTDSKATRAILSVLIILCHREMGAAVLVAYLCLEPRSWPAILPGLVLGEAVMLLYTQWLLVPAPVSRAAYAVDHAAEFWGVFWAHPLLHLLASFGPFWVYVISRKSLSPGATAVCVGALALAIVSQDFTRVFVIVSAPLLLEIAREALADIRQQGAIAIGGIRLGIHALWPLMFLQFQFAGPKIQWARGIEIALGP